MKQLQQAERGTALVTGATGAVGPVLVRRLAGSGYRVRALARRMPGPGVLPAGVECMTGEITDQGLLDRAAAGADLVFHLAALLHVNSPPASLKQEYERINVEGTRRLVRAARRAGCSRMIFFSTINVYGSTPPGQIFDEDAPLRPADDYAASKACGEEIVLSGIDAVVLRLAAVYGPRMKGNYRRMAGALRRRLFFPVGRGENRRTLVFDEDAASAALVAAVHPEASGKIYNVTDGRVHRLREIIAAICAALDRRYPLITLPYPVVLAGSGAVEDLARLCGARVPLNRALAKKMVEESAVSGEKMRSELGYSSGYDLERGWRKTVQAFAADRREGGAGG